MINGHSTAIQVQLFEEKIMKINKSFVTCNGDSSSSGAESGTDSGNNGGSDNYGSESYP